MGLAISCGMALTISLVILAAMSGKHMLLKIPPLHAYVETGVELFAGTALILLGTIFLLGVL